MNKENTKKFKDYRYMIEPVITNANEFTLATYFQWKESNTNKCLKYCQKEE